MPSAVVRRSGTTSRKSPSSVQMRKRAVKHVKKVIAIAGTSGGPLVACKGACGSSDRAAGESRSTRVEGTCADAGVVACGGAGVVVETVPATLGGGGEAPVSESDGSDEESSSLTADAASDGLSMSHQAAARAEIERESAEVDAQETAVAADDVEVVSSLLSALTSNEDEDEDMEDLTTVMAAPVVEGRPRRAAAESARVLIAEASEVDNQVSRANQAERAKKRKAAAALGDDCEEDEPEDEICEVDKVVAVKEDEDRGLWFRVLWKTFEGPADQFTWVHQDDMEGATEWVDVGQRYLAKWRELETDVREAFTLRRFIQQDRAALTMGANSDCTCVYEAVATIMRLQASEFCFDEQVKTAFEERYNIDRMLCGGLTAEQVQWVFEFLVARGWKINLKANQYKGGGTGALGLVLSTDDGPGVYFVGTVDELRNGHCFVLEIDGESQCFIHEGGLKMGAGEYPYAKQIRWVRKCVTVEDAGECAAADAEIGDAANVKTVGSGLVRRKNRRKRVRHGNKSQEEVEVIDVDKE